MAGGSGCPSWATSHTGRGLGQCGALLCPEPAGGTGAPCSKPLGLAVPSGPGQPPCSSSPPPLLFAFSLSAPRGEGAWARGLAWQPSHLSALRSRRAQGHPGTQPPSCHTWMCSVSPGSSRAGAAPSWQPRLGDTAVRCHTPRVDNIQIVQDMNQPRRSAAAAPGQAEVPRRCPGSRAVPLPNSERAGGQVTGGTRPAPLPPPEHPRAPQNPGGAFLCPFAPLCSPVPSHGRA